MAKFKRPPKFGPDPLQKYTNARKAAAKAAKGSHRIGDQKRDKRGRYA